MYVFLVSVKHCFSLGNLFKVSNADVLPASLVKAWLQLNLFFIVVFFPTFMLILVHISDKRGHPRSKHQQYANLNSNNIVHSKFWLWTIFYLYQIFKWDKTTFEYISPMEHVFYYEYALKWFWFPQNDFHTHVTLLLTTSNGYVLSLILHW